MLKNTKSIYENYIGLIDDFFGNIKHYLKDYEYGHIDLGNLISNYPLISDLMLDSLDDLDETINSFWQDNFQLVLDAEKSKQKLKCIYSGGITPHSLENFIKKAGLYIDNVIIQDPIFSLTKIRTISGLNKKEYLNRLIRHVFNIWKLKDLLITSSEDNIITILPVNMDVIKKEKRYQLLESAEKNFTNYMNRLFVQEWKNKDEVYEYLQKYVTCKEVYDNIKSIKILPYLFQEFVKYQSFFDDFDEDKVFEQKIINHSKGWHFCLYIYSQFIRVEEHMYFCEELCAEPIYDYDLPWFFFNYRINGMDMDASIVNALQKEKFKWINQLPLSVIKILREENELDYMRNMIRSGITDLKAKHDENLVSVSEQVERNFKDSFKKQSNEIHALKSKVAKYFKKDLPIVTSGALAGFIPVLGNAISLLFAGRDIKNILSERKINLKKLNDKEKTPINLLMKSYESSETEN